MPRIDFFLSRGVAGPDMPSDEVQVETALFDYDHSVLGIREFLANRGLLRSSPFE